MNPYKPSFFQSLSYCREIPNTSIPDLLSPSCDHLCKFIVLMLMLCNGKASKLLPRSLGCAPGMPGGNPWNPEVGGNPTPWRGENFSPVEFSSQVKEIGNDRYLLRMWGFIFFWGCHRKKWKKKHQVKHFKMIYGLSKQFFGGHWG